ncbi:hypothetical protein ALO58_200055 [Pseudomonas savastanoi pv. savastanoi]|nr:hypothetical protein ALO58_200055 [Pseudomonas savastanoi pv. savastanoi]
MYGKPCRIAKAAVNRSGDVFRRNFPGFRLTPPNKRLSRAFIFLFRHLHIFNDHCLWRELYRRPDKPRVSLYDHHDHVYMERAVYLGAPDHIHECEFGHLHCVHDDAHIQHCRFKGKYPYSFLSQPL